MRSVNAAALNAFFSPPSGYSDWAYVSDTQMRRFSHRDWPVCVIGSVALNCRPINPWVTSSLRRNIDRIQAKTENRFDPWCSYVLWRKESHYSSLLFIHYEHGYAAYVLSDSYEKPVAQYKICTESHSPLLRADIPVLSPAKHLANVCSVTFHSLVIRINTRRESTTWTLHHRRHLSGTVWCSIDAGHSR